MTTGVCPGVRQFAAGSAPAEQNDRAPVPVVGHRHAPADRGSRAWCERDLRPARAVVLPGITQIAAEEHGAGATHVVGERVVVVEGGARPGGEMPRRAVVLPGE